jgi:hypothetical protein
MAIVTVAVMVIVPLPEPEAALKYFCAAVPAGIVNGYEMPLIVGSVQEPTQAACGTVLMVEAVVDSVCEPEVKGVDVIVRFQPAPLPVLSATVNTNA